MRRRRRGLLLPFAVIAASSLVAYTASNAVPATRAGQVTSPITVDAKKPGSCAGITLTALRVGNGGINGSSSSELILGGPAGQTISGAGGSDCLLGGGGNDTVQGGAGVDVCIGGPGTDTFNASCETRIQ